MEQFVREYRPDMKAVTADLTAMARANDEDVNADLPAHLQRELELFFRSRLARQLFGASAYYEVYNREDETVREALRLLENSDPLAAARGN